MSAPSHNGSAQQAKPLSREAMRRLAAVAADDANDTLRWPESDLPQVWTHQFHASIVAELAAMDGIAALRAEELLRSHERPAPSTFNVLVAHRHPNQQLVRLAERVVLHQLSDPGPIVAREIGLALHAALLLVERLRCGQAGAGTTASPMMNDAELRRRAEWMLRQPWIDDAARAIANEALSELHVSDYPIR